MQIENRNSKGLFRDLISKSDFLPQQNASEADQDFSKYAAELTNYGLTPNQARVYLFLLRNGAITASQVSKQLDLHRVDVYRQLRELEELGMVEVYLESPRKYVALDPKVAISAVISKMEGRLKSLKKSSRTFGSVLEEYAEVERPKHDYLSASNYSEGIFKLVAGRERYYDEMRRLVNSAKTEILRIATKKGVTRTFLPNALYKDYLSAKERGVALRAIAEVNSENIDQAKLLAKAFELRHLDSIPLRLIIVDRSVTIISTRFDEDNMSGKTIVDNYMLIADPKFAEASCFFFEHLWNQSTPLSAEQPTQRKLR